MSIEWVLYWIDALNSINIISNLFVALSFVAILAISSICFLGKIDSFLVITYDGYKSCLSILKIVIPIFILSLLIVTIIPSKKTMYAMAVARYSKDSEIPRKALMAIESKLDEIIEKGK